MNKKIVLKTEVVDRSISAEGGYTAGRDSVTTRIALSI
jgi:hypothetical protein